MRQRRNRWMMTIAVAVVAAQSMACSLSFESILEMQDGSVMELTVLNLPPNNLPLEGGTVMDIDITLSLLELLLGGTISGDVSIGDLLFAAPPFNFLGIPALNTGNICVIKDETVPGGGTFVSNLGDETATFDVVLATVALIGNPVLAATIPGGGFQFPFNLSSTVPLTLGDMLGLLGGSGSIEITQALDETLDIMVDLGGGPIPISAHIGGQVVIASTDAFPSTTLVEECIAFLEE